MAGSIVCGYDSIAQLDRIAVLQSDIDLAALVPASVAFHLKAFLHHSLYRVSRDLSGEGLRAGQMFKCRSCAEMVAVLVGDHDILQISQLEPELIDIVDQVSQLMEAGRIEQDQALSRVDQVR